MSSDTEERRETAENRLIRFTEHVHAAILQQDDVVWTRMTPSKGIIWVQKRDEHEFTIKIESFDAGTAPKV